MSVLTRAIAVLTCTLLFGGLTAGVVATPASATSTILCTGYTGCYKAGMGNAGYKAAGGSMYWQMYSGHNCTNYVAYRMVRSGMPNSRPWSGGGNATYWGTSNSSITDGVPAVGAVAWWKANVRPAGSAGHVAYVEQVISPDEIIVSQDSWGGDFSWARITRVGGSWPSGFVHFNDVPLQNVEKPVVEGVAKVGAVVSATNGTWNPSGATYSYQWRANGVVIPAATSPTLTLQLAQRDKRIKVLVTATQPGFPKTTVSSNRTPAVGPGQITNDLAPSIDREARVDAALTASPGTWTPGTSTLGYQWLAGSRPIPGATSPTYTPGPDQVGKPISLRVTASKVGYDDVSVESPLTAPVAKASFRTDAQPKISGSPRLGETLSLVPGAFTPAAEQTTTTWLRDGTPVDGATGPTYQLTTDDLGSTLSTRTKLTRPGYTPLTVESARTDVVQTVSRLRVGVDRTRPGRLGLQIRALAAGVDVVPGRIQVLVDGVVLRGARLRDGERSLTVRRLDRGRHSFTVEYVGTATVTASNWSRTRWVR